MKNKLVLALVTVVLLGTALSAAPLAPGEQALAVRVREALRLAPHYGVFDSLSFRIDGRNVTLLGQVRQAVTRQEAFQRVSKLAGVGDIVDAIQVLPLSPSDEALRHRVYRAVFSRAGLYRYAMGADPSIHIIVRDGRVTLEGMVSNEGDANFARMAARGVVGVRSVTNRLQTEAQCLRGRVYLV